jgi:hypothetical protein
MTWVVDMPVGVARDANPAAACFTQVPADDLIRRSAAAATEHVRSQPAQQVERRVLREGERTIGACERGRQYQKRGRSSFPMAVKNNELRPLFFPFLAQCMSRMAPEGPQTSYQQPRIAQITRMKGFE